MSDRNFSLAYGMKKRAKKMAEGGRISPDANHESSCTEHCEQPCAIHEQANLPEATEHMENDVKVNDPAMREDDRRLNEHGAKEVGAGGYAKGGMVHEAEGESERSRGVSKAGEHVRLDENDEAKDEHYRILGQLKADRRDRKFMADGGMIEDNEQDEAHEMDMVGRIMKSRAQEFSHGGQVANQDHGENDNELAGFSPNEFDDLVLRDDDMEEAEYTGANSGDELSSPGEDERRKDMVSRIMASRRKKDKLPNPR